MYIGTTVSFFAIRDRAGGGGINRLIIDGSGNVGIGTTTNASYKLNVEGSFNASNIITSNLNALDVTQRPIHCADKKREVLYIKDENKWEKEDDDKKKIRKAIKRVASKNQRLLPKFKEAHPDCNRASSKFSDQYNKIIVESMGGSGDNDSEKEDKIIKNITKVTTIEKT